MDESCKRYRWVAIVYLTAGWLSGFGCMSFNLGNRTYESPASYVDQGGVLKQNGESPLIRTQDDRIEIYYPKPFASKPNLTLGKQPNSVSMSEIQLLEQTPDHFTIRWNGSGEGNLSWHAEGVPGSAPVEVSPAKTVTPAGGPS